METEIIKKENIEISLKLYNDNCFSVLPTIEENSVNLIFADLPYGKTQNKWDSKLDLSKLWQEWKRILKENGKVILTGAEPFTSELVNSNREWFKYDLIWKKTVSSGQLNVNRMPLRTHESILVFYKKSGVYNQQFTEGKPYNITRKKSNKTNEKGESGYNAQKTSSKQNTGYRHPISVLEFPNPRIKDEHPNHKPLELMKWIVNSYTNENETVLDPCMGTGATGHACKDLNRKFIGIELDTKYFDKAKKKLFPKQE